jgi:hypothetical protein
MRKVFDQLQARLQAFIAQRDDLALVVRCATSANALILKVLEGLQESSSSEIFWVFPEEFSTAITYVSAVVQSFAAQHELIRLSLEKEGMKPWPLLPANVRNEKLQAARRLRELMVFARSLLPAPEGFLVAFVFLPPTVSDPAAYGELMADVLRHEFPFSWCHHIRAILRDDPADPALARVLGEAPRMVWYAPDLSPAALEKALEEEAGDEALPLEQRLQALHVTAGTDFAHKRYPEAMGKYQLLFEYYARTGNHALTALVWNGMGEVHLAEGRPVEAAACFEGALIPASEGNPPPLPVLLNVVLNLANLRLAERRWSEAEAYFDQVQKLASIHRNPALKVLALEDLGVAQYEQGKVSEALKAWQAGSIVAENQELAEQRQALLRRLQTHYARAQNREKLREVEGRLAASAAPPAQGG